MRDTDALRGVVAFVRTNQYSELYGSLPEWPDGDDAEHYLARIEPTELDDFRRAAQLAHYPETEVRLIASHFATASLDDLILLPQLRSARSASVRRGIEETGTPAALFAAPMSLQMGPLFYRTCRDARVPAALVSPRNPPVTRQVIEETGITYVCALPDVAADIYAELALYRIAERITRWHLIVPLGNPPPPPLPSGTTIVEYHLFPGIAIAEGKAGEEACRVSDDYRIDIVDGAPLITSLTNEALPLVRYRPEGVRASCVDAAKREFTFTYGG